MSVRLGSKADVLKSLRTLLRLNRSTTANKEWNNIVLEKFRKRQHETDRTKIKAYRAEAIDLVNLWSGVEEQKRLWSMDAGIEKRMRNADIVKKSARLVGLQIPDMYTDKVENKL
ncbi:hypothetical protein H310_08188 [Aphanomyces invadans]|uniref:Uncharacterized protein n=1 Tax=Aphanomyces invadans TaxID=157072 RepID=A0A024U0V1_9STRA|nr:hypothetical protein H310_08188 [Aphanomyces invadans]ETV99516.1 hypothetical protein H310_08188 [Aphanomyces invadans]|eukprot:XP_008872072.1 hypothetical protein H310_08188 [Aphanomyces invadans]